MSRLVNCQSYLIEKAEKQGFLTFDDVLDASDTFSLSAAEVDKVSASIQLRGIIVYEEKPQQLDSDEINDFSQTDYNEVYNRICSLSEELIPLIEEVKEIIPPQYGEISILTQQAASGNSFARERLILSHMRVAIKIALSYAIQKRIPIEDAISAAFGGLVEGTDKYDPNGFSTFQGYVSMWIQQRIQRDCKPYWMEYYCPVHVRENWIPIYEQFEAKATGDGEYDLGVVKEIALNRKKTGIYVIKTLRKIYSLVDKKVSYETICEDLEIIDDLAPDPMIEALKANEREVILSQLDRLTEREASVIRLRAGLDDDNPKTLEEIGEIYDVTRERIRQIENKALKKLRRNKVLRNYYYRSND